MRAVRGLTGRRSRTACTFASSQSKPVEAVGRVFPYRPCYRFRVARLCPL